MLFFDFKRPDQNREPKMILQAMTPEMEDALGCTTTEVTALPYRVGRLPHASLTPILDRHRKRISGRNQLDLADEGPRLHISRRHFRIVSKEHGLFLEDLGSACGTIVDNVRVGGHGKGGRVPLQHGSVIILGKGSSPFVMRFMLEETNPVARSMRQLTDLYANGVLSDDTFETKAAFLNNQLGY